MHLTPLPMPRPARARSGFTLIELLTVIAIIGVLAAIIIPTVGKVRKTAKNAQCVSNLRQWAQAVNLYAHENKGNYLIRGGPGNLSWTQITNVVANMPYAPYMGASANVGAMRRCDSHNDPAATVCYYINRPINPATNRPADLDRVPLNRVRNPAAFMLFIDIDTAQTAPNGHAFTGAAGLATFVTPLFADPFKDRHSGRANAVFADAHVKSITQSDILAHGDTWTRIDN